MGDVKPWFMGEKPMFCHLTCFTNLFNGLVLFVGGSYGWWLRQLLPLGVGWQDCQSLSHTYTPPTTVFTLLSSTFSKGEDYGLFVPSMFGSSSRWSVDSRTQAGILTQRGIQFLTSGALSYLHVGTNSGGYRFKP